MRRLVVVLLSCSALVACGGDDDGSGDGGRTVSPEAFEDAVRESCEARDDEAEAVFAEFPDAPTDDNIMDVSRAFVPIIERYRDDVEAAGVPEGLEQEHADYLTAIADLLVQFEAAADDPEAARELFERDSTELTALERELGIEECG